jgi:hypothetical protein
VSVDTYLKGKNLAPYQRLRRDGLQVLLAPVLNSQAAVIELSVRRVLLRKTLSVYVEPRGDHFHAPSCRH